MSFQPTAQVFVDIEPETESRPSIQWIQGQKQLKAAGGVAYLGGFFIPSKNLPGDFEIPAGFEAGEHTFRTGKTESGYFGLSAEIALIATRRCWMKKDGSATRYYPWKEYAQGAKGQIQSLVLVKGCNMPLVMSFNGKTKGESYEALAAAADALAGKLNVALPKGARRYPRMTFFVPVISSAAVDPVKGFVMAVGKDDKSSPVTPMIIHPTLGDLKNITDKTLERQYVGDEAFELCQIWYQEAVAAGWLEAWNRAAVVEEDEHPHPADESGEAPF